MIKSVITDEQHKRLQDIYTRYRRLYEAPDQASPMIIIYTPAKEAPSMQEQLQDPLVMLRAQLDTIRRHLEVGDDCVPTVRVNFGTGQVASAFGGEIVYPENSLPAVKGHVLKSIDDIDDLEQPTMDSGLYPRLHEWTQIWLENLPPGFHIQHPDIQSPFNTAHLLRGNDIFTDFYDHPDAVECLLDRITDFMIDVVPSLKAPISEDGDWFFDWGALWKGAARISNCSTTMISPEFYNEYILPRDARFMQAVGGGRVHYCGGAREIIEDFFRVPAITGLDCDCQFHDPWKLARSAPPRLTLIMQCYGEPFPWTQRLLDGDWPRKRNLILITQASNVMEAKQLLEKLRKSIPEGTE